jgi:hypothetical protein
MVNIVLIYYVRRSLFYGILITYHFDSLRQTLVGAPRGRD